MPEGGVADEGVEGEGVQRVLRNMAVDCGDDGGEAGCFPFSGCRLEFRSRQGAEDGDLVVLLFGG